MNLRSGLSDSYELSHADKSVILSAADLLFQDVLRTVDFVAAHNNIAVVDVDLMLCCLKYTVLVSKGPKLKKVLDTVFVDEDEGDDEKTPVLDASEQAVVGELHGVYMKHFDRLQQQVRDGTDSSTSTQQLVQQMTDDHLEVKNEFDEGDADEGDADEGDADEGDADEGDADEGDADEGDADEWSFDCRCDVCVQVAEMHNLTEMPTQTDSVFATTIMKALQKVQRLAEKS